ncbi:hypothetical protein ACQKGC_10385 [Allorhizobium pseudoryzae]|uniref:hypothetical protein n=1 Tax=Allorhizobium pseudoryzae TaxID=379684 RepID=UPI003CFC9204
MDAELSVMELANDPLIGMLMRADGVGQDQLSELLCQAARRQVAHLQDRIRQARAEDFYNRLDLAYQVRPAGSRPARPSGV